MDGGVGGDGGGESMHVNERGGRGGRGGEGSNQMQDRMRGLPAVLTLMERVCTRCVIAMGCGNFVLGDDGRGDRPESVPRLETFDGGGGGLGGEHGVGGSWQGGEGEGEAVGALNETSTLVSGGGREGCLKEEEGGLSC